MFEKTVEVCDRERRNKHQAAAMMHPSGGLSLHDLRTYTVEHMQNELAMLRVCELEEALVVVDKLVDTRQRQRVRLEFVIVLHDVEELIG